MCWDIGRESGGKQEFRKWVVQGGQPAPYLPALKTKLTLTPPPPPPPELPLPVRSLV